MQIFRFPLWEYPIPQIHLVGFSGFGCLVVYQQFRVAIVPVESTERYEPGWQSGAVDIVAKSLNAD